MEGAEAHVNAEKGGVALRQEEKGSVGFDASEKVWKGANPAGRKQGVSVYFRDIRYSVNERVQGEGCFGWLRRRASSCRGKGEKGAGSDDVENGVGHKEEAGHIRRKEILHGVSGYVKPGKMLAVMGASGSGKTTLLNVIAGRLGNTYTGDMLFAGRPRDRRSRRKIAYVTQEDLFFSNLSVQDTLRFTASVRLPDSVSRETKEQCVIEVMARLRLEKTAHTRVGDGLFDKGISGGERKRMSIANELLTDPAVMILDEPTSGLDSSTALTVVQIMKELAKEGKTVITTIHQPSSQMFAEFDQLLLLSEGSTVYFGDAKGAYDYFAQLGFRCPFGYNYADYYLQLLTNDKFEGGTSIRQQLVESWARSEKYMDFTHTLVDDTQDATDAGLFNRIKTSVRDVWRRNGTKEPYAAGLTDRGDEGDEDWAESRPYVTSWWTQFRSLSWRAYRQKRGKLLDLWPIVQVLCVLFLVGIVWFRMEVTEATIDDRIGNLFFTVVFWSFFSLFSSAYAFPSEKSIVSKDRAAGAYQLSAYYLAKTLTEAPLEIFYPLTFGVIVYWMCALNPNGWRFVTYIMILLLHVLVSQAAGLCISAATMNIKKALTLATVFMLTSMMVVGFYVSTDNLPGWILWTQHISFIMYGFYAMFFNEFNGRSFPCTEPPTEYRLADCPIRDVHIFEAYSANTEFNLWGNFGLMFVFLIVFHFTAYSFLRFLHKGHKKA